MDPERVFILQNGDMRGAMKVSAIGFGRGILEADRLHRAEVIPTEPLQFEHDLGSTPRDLIGTGHGDCTILLSDRVIGTLRRAGITGWITYPVEIRRKRGELVPGYHGVGVTGRCGYTERVKHALARRHPMDVPYYPDVRMIAELLDPAAWDGSDVFLPGDHNYILVVERVKRVLQEAKVQNIRFDPFAEMELRKPAETTEKGRADEQ